MATPYIYIGASSNFPDDKAPEAAHQKIWLANSYTWAGFEKTAWKPLGVLGGGGYGIVGKFSYRGSDDMPKDMVVKQVAGTSQRRDLEKESRYMHRLNATKSPHIIKLYKGYHTDGGTGTMMDRDPLPYHPITGVWDRDREVARIYLEYCGNQDLYSVVEQAEELREQEGKFILEEHLWRVFHCLARGVLAMDQGSEDPANPKANWVPIAHLDIKPENALVGECFDGHNVLTPIKLADFGEALSYWAGLPEDKWWEFARWKGTPAWQSPEQESPEKHPRSLGEPSKVQVWSIGAVLHSLMTAKEVDQTRSGLFWYPREGNIPGPFEGQGNNYQTMGFAFFEVITENYGEMMPYSKKLMDTILNCLADDARERPSITALVEYLDKIIEDYDESRKNDIKAPASEVFGVYRPWTPVSMDNRWVEWCEKNWPDSDGKPPEFGWEYSSSEDSESEGVNQPSGEGVKFLLSEPQDASPLLLAHVPVNVSREDRVAQKSQSKRKLDESDYSDLDDLDSDESDSDGRSANVKRRK